MRDDNEGNIVHRPKARIFSSFAFLNATQFLGALNDNIFKLVIAFLLIGLWGTHQSNLVFATTGFVYVLPFLLFSIPAGTLADKFSKRNITVVTKILEVVTMSCGVIAFGTHSVWGSYTVLFMMATQSAIFGPSKYSIVPELVDEKQISKANGILVALTVLAMIVGFFLGAFLTELTNYNFALIALVCVGISVLGLISALCIQKTPAVGTTSRQTIRVVTKVIRILIRTRRENYLFESLLGSSYFYLIGAYVQLNIITYAIQSLGLSEVHGAYLFLTAAIGIIIGSLLAGILCGKKVELGLAPIGTMGMAIFAVLLLAFDHSITWVIICLVLLGIFGGLLLVPTDAFIQTQSPKKERGENVSCGNFLSFVGILIASFLIYFLGEVLQLSAAKGFACVAALTLVVGTIFTKRMYDTFVRLPSRYLTRHWTVEGEIPEEKPVIFLTENPDPLYLTTIQKRYMRFILDPAPTFISRLCKAALTSTNYDKKARRWLARGYSLTIPTTLTDYAKALSQEQGLALLHVSVDHLSKTFLVH